jgi:hypothetical protein
MGRIWELLKENAMHVKICDEEIPPKKEIVLSVDVMYFTRIPFLITVSRDIRLITAIERKRL